MKCSTMFKRLASLAAAAAICLLLPVSAMAASPGIPENSGEILLVHPRSPEEPICSGVEQLVTTAAAMSKVVDFGTPEECAPVLEKYRYVILYGLSSVSEEFDAAIKGSKAHFMVLGGSVMEHILSLAGKQELQLGTESQKTGRLTYRFPSGQEYESLIRWENLGQYLSDGYENGTVTALGKTYPFCTEVAGVRYIPVTDYTDTLAFTALIEEIVQWMWPYNDRPTSYAQFLVLNGVYPFTPAEKLQQMIDGMEKADVPYVISAMPIENNTDYPAMLQYFQLLRYAQDNGGAVILHAPILHKTNVTAEELFEKLNAMTMPYIENGVYPLGIEVPRLWLNREPYLTVLKRYRTVFVYDDNQGSRFDMAAHTSLFARQGHQVVYPLMQVDETGISQLDCYPSVSYVDAGQWENAVSWAANSRSSNNPYMDLRDYNHTVWTDDCGLTWQDRMAYINGSRADSAFEPYEYEEDYNFGRSPLVRMSIDLQNQNRVLMALVALFTVTFISLIGYARHRMRRRFFGADDGKEE